MDAYGNFGYGLITTAPSPATSGTSLTVDTGHGARFPAVPFNATVWPLGEIPDPTNAEIVRVTAIATNTLTITRAQESTTARAIIVGDQIAATITKKTIDDLRADDLTVAQISPVTGPAVVGRSSGTGDAETLPLGAGLAVVSGSLVATAKATGIFDYGFSTTTTAPPANQTLRINAAYPYTAATTVWADYDSANSEDLYWGWQRITVGSYLMVQDKDNHDQFAEFTVTGAPVDHGTYVELPVVHKATGGTPLAAQAVLVRVTTVSGGGTRTGAVGLVIDGGGSAITTGVKGFLSIPFACTITGWTLLSTDGSATSGSIVVDIWKDTYANYPPTVADTITASAKPTLSSVNKNASTTLTGWTTSIAAGDVLGFNVDSASTVTRVVLSLTVQAT